ncbi:hypothetical protein IFM89_025115 [Coptis chinensis]|uniref:pectinesterase n=1 Tax=Coptis chinensis TaxID=261450 RepID=A0A835HXD0_9MAGN|nr:hypothetical protein IFM89_025115 [Coptis chinensis]
MNSSVLCGVFLLVLLSSQLPTICCTSGDDNSLNYISWSDLSDYRDLEAEGIFSPTRHIVVAKDGSGDSASIQAAVDMIPHNNAQRVKILIYPGVYRERLHIPRTKPYISLIGNGSAEVTITYNAKASDKDMYGRVLGTYGTATVDVASDYFVATELTIENTIDARGGGVGMQAVALKVSGDKAMFFRVTVRGTQDTILDLTGTHYYYQCFIQGSVDFICGNARSLFEDCTLKSMARRSGAIAAHHRNSTEENTGFSFYKCKVTGTGINYLGRAWGRYARIVYSLCRFQNIINPSGWADWGDPSRQQTVTFGEYECRGRGADKTNRVGWAKNFSPEEVGPYMDKSFIDAAHEIYACVRAGDALFLSAWKLAVDSVISRGQVLDMESTRPFT